MATAVALGAVTIVGCTDEGDASCRFTSPVVLEGLEDTAEVEVVLVGSGNRLDGFLDFNGHLYALAADRQQSYPEGPGRFAGTATQLDAEGERVVIDLGDDGRLELEAVYCD